MSEIKIVATPLSGANTCKFTVSINLHDGPRIICSSKELAQGSPLLENLFSLEGISEVLVQGDEVICKKNESSSWNLLAKEIGQKIRLAITSEQNLFADNLENLYENQKSESGVSLTPLDQANPTVVHLQKLLKESINPSLASHGGRAELVNFQDDKVYLRLGGGCQGCGQASATLKEGIEKHIKQEIPSIIEVIDVTDHQQGENPYY